MTHASDTYKMSTWKALTLKGLLCANNLAHRYLIIPFIYGGQLVISGRLHSAFLVVVVLSQLAFLNCPMTVLSNRLRKLLYMSGHASSYEVSSGRVEAIYQRLGRFAVVPISVYIFCVTLLVRAVTPWK